MRRVSAAALEAQAKQLLDNVDQLAARCQLLMVANGHVEGDEAPGVGVSYGQQLDGFEEAAERILGALPDEVAQRLRKERE